MKYKSITELYNTIKDDTKGLDSIYGDYISKVIGIDGLVRLLTAGLLESCGVINGRRLYVLCDLKGE